MIPQNSWEEGDVLNHVCDSERLMTDVSMFKTKCHQHNRTDARNDITTDSGAKLMDLIMIYSNVFLKRMSLLKL